MPDCLRRPSGNSRPARGVDIVRLCVDPGDGWCSSAQSRCPQPLLWPSLGSSTARAQVRQDEPSWQAFIAAAGSDPKQAQAALADIAARWRDNYAAMILDVVRFLPSPRANQAADEGPVAGLRRCDRRAATGCHSGTRRLSADGPIVSGRRHASPTDHFSRTADTAAIRRRPARLAKMDVGASRPPASGLRLVQGGAL